MPLFPTAFWGLTKSPVPTTAAFVVLVLHQNIDGDGDGGDEDDVEETYHGDDDEAGRTHHHHDDDDDDVHGGGASSSFGSCNIVVDTPEPNRPGMLAVRPRWQWVLVERAQSPATASDRTA